MDRREFLKLGIIGTIATFLGGLISKFGYMNEEIQQSIFIQWPPSKSGYVRFGPRVTPQILEIAKGDQIEIYEANTSVSGTYIITNINHLDDGAIEWYVRQPIFQEGIYG